MWATILSFITPYITKYLVPALGGVCVILIVICLYLYSSNETLTGKVAKMEEQMITLTQTAEDERTKAKEKIDLQNTQIDEYKLDLEEYNRIVGEKEKALMEARFTKQQEVDKELSVDNSDTNQLKVMTKLMREFADETD